MNPLTWQREILELNSRLLDLKGKTGQLIKMLGWVGKNCDPTCFTKKGTDKKKKKKKKLVLFCFMGSRSALDHHIYTPSLLLYEVRAIFKFLHFWVIGDSSINDLTFGGSLASIPLVLFLGSLFFCSSGTLIGACEQLAHWRFCASSRTILFK